MISIWQASMLPAYRHVHMTRSRASRSCSREKHTGRVSRLPILTQIFGCYSNGSCTNSGFHQAPWEACWNIKCNAVMCASVQDSPWEPQYAACLLFGLIYTPSSTWPVTRPAVNAIWQATRASSIFGFR